VFLVVLPAACVLSLRLAIGRFDGQRAKSVSLSVGEVALIEVARRFPQVRAFA
jgi:hypothetical protein